ncbi:hypothetical protein EDD21DRAFT_152506 [Dissophora ornata]|nr:hypothetical protein EDD21DRAFT_152506 [Dissophora ornata]
MSSSPSSPTAADHSMHISPFAHPLDSTSSSGSSNYPKFTTDRTHDVDSVSHMPVTPGEEMVFKRGPPLTSHRPSTRSDPGHAIAKAYLPSLGNINKSSSDPESADLNKEILPGRVLLDQNRVWLRPNEVQSTPINMPVIHHPSPTTSSRASAVLSEGFSSRSPSPNPSTITQGSVMSHQYQQQSQRLAPNSSFSSANNNVASRPYNQYSPPAALRPDSICYFPDNSPVLAPSVLAAVDARLKEASRQRALAGPSSASSLRPPRPQSAIPGSTHSNDSGVSKISSFGLSAPIMTHHSVLASSESIRSREDLYDALSKDDDDDESDMGLARPKPGFASSGRQSSKSSRRNSISSSVAGSGIELNAMGERYMVASLPKHVQVRINEGSIKGSKKRGLVSAAMVSQSQKNESYISSDSDLTNGIYLEKSEWLKSKSKTSRKWRSICCVVGILAFIGVIAGIVLGFVTRRGKIDGLAQPTYVPPCFSVLAVCCLIHSALFLSPSSRECFA